ncbi:MAG: FMN-binding negative transcriptional regulator [Sphingobacteriales bacterium]|nr:MAG: FMN-binding negative transcriptional regulator [Sphingobacteriales bacterium]
MYRVKDFIEKDQNEILGFMEANPFMTLIGVRDGMPAVTQVPVMIAVSDGTITLTGHVMKSTDHHKAISANPEVMVLFQGPGCYVSSSWYSERGHGATWNYMTVQARGAVELLDSHETLDILKALTHHFEKGREPQELVENMTEAYISGNLKAITGFRIRLQDVQAVFKLSQNRDDASYYNIVKKLQQEKQAGANFIAAEMIKRRPHLFAE